MPLSEAQKKIKKWREDPVSFVVDELKVVPDAWQVEVLRKFPTTQRIAMKCGKGPGKTCIEAWLAWNFLATRLHPKVAATSISADNLSDNLWSEMAKWQNNSPFLKKTFIWTKTRIFSRDHPETWWMSARSWAKTGDSNQQADTLAGLHADYMLFILDEVGGIPDAVMVAAEAGLASGIETKIVMAGNPTHLDGPLYRACTKERHLWYIIEVTGDPDDPMRSPRVSIQWAKDQIDTYGKENPWVLVNVFGKFPPSSINTLLGPEEVSAAMKRHLSEDQYQWSQKRLGIDVARFGDDRTVIFPRQGLVAFRPVIMRHERTTAIAARVMLAKDRWKSNMEFVDDSGHWGHGVIDNLITAGHSPIAIMFGDPAIDPRYRNRRTEMWMKMADWVKRGGVLPNMPELTRELTAPTYTFIGGKLALEDKDLIKKRISGMSTDLGDGLCLTFAIPDMPANETAEALATMGFGKKMEAEYDPFSEERLSS
jgi:hypothetical protein